MLRLKGGPSSSRRKRRLWRRLELLIRHPRVGDEPERALASFLDEGESKGTWVSDPRHTETDHATPRQLPRKTSASQGGGWPSSGRRKAAVAPKPPSGTKQASHL
eukprot:3387943-Pyramimonas_sp.AAC.1